MSQAQIRAALLIMAGLLAAGIAFYTFSSNLNADAGALLKPDDRALVQKGMEIYQFACVTCHGKNLEGQENWKSRDAEGLAPAPPHDASGHTWHHTDDLLFDLVKYGLAKSAGFEDYETNMPVFEDVLSDEEIIAVLSYIKSTWPQEIRERHDQLNQQSKRQQ